MYFVITGGDGEAFAEKVTEEVLLKRITPDGNGNTYYGKNPKYLEKLPDVLGHLDTDEVVIIKGEVVVPKPVVTVTQYTLD